MKNWLTKSLISHAGLEATVLRLPIGLILAAHGGQKLFAWFGGYGLEGTGQWMASVGLQPGFLMALLAGSAEFFGGAALMLGLMTRIAAAANVLTMAVALLWVHASQGFFMSAHGIEYALALLAATVSLMIMGGGQYSLERYLLDNGFLGENHDN
ncbi:MAG: DoxX family protein [Methylovulum sp.]|uniref:DoxX family protein n=1 Tax=Methylovulum sp. TaxID=1916980 RepID=UPI00263188EE|nr:DoxX family protein [Methylovulum sp.]MDD2725603.1 DoxX family protein [Methylovulum sp.]MDD5125656.1 DoxX family protein [Methylovulum sp.]